MVYFSIKNSLLVLVLFLAVLSQGLAKPYTPQTETAPIAPGLRNIPDPLDQVPKPVKRIQNINALSGVCEKRWPELTNDLGIIKSPMEEGMTLYLVPCAHWAHNIGWAGYVTIDEKSHPDGFITKVLRFVDYSPYEGVVAKDLVYNIRWNEKEKFLLAQFFLNGNDFCGTKSQFKWDGGQQNLLLMELWKQDNCKPPGGKWEAVVTKGKSALSKSEVSPATAPRQTNEPSGFLKKPYHNFYFE